LSLTVLASIPLVIILTYWSLESIQEQWLFYGLMALSCNFFACNDMDREFCDYYSVYTGRTQKKRKFKKTIMQISLVH